MENNEWEDQLRDLLGEYKTSGTSSPLNTEPDALNTTPEDLTPSTPDQVQAWKRIEASLDAADQAFDETIRQRVNHFHPQYDPHSWPILLKRLADTRYLRAKLIVLKSVEVTILLLLILSAVNYQRLGKMPFDSSPLNEGPENATPLKTEQSTKGTQQQKNTPAATPGTNNDYTQADPGKNSSVGQNANLLSDNVQSENNSISSKNNSNNKSNNNSKNKTSNKTDYKNLASTEIPNSVSIAFNELIDENPSSSLPHTPSSLTSEIPVMVMNGLDFTIEPMAVPDINVLAGSYITEPISTAGFVSGERAINVVPEPKFINPVKHTFTEFAMLAQVDYNALKMPEDRLYSSSREIIFPSKGIMSPGYGAGFTIAIGHPIWALETGVIYSAKDFEPGRQLIVGGAFDNGSVNFEAMKLQVVSLPVQYRYRFDHTGRVKTYGIAGGGFHVIAESDIDVAITYHSPALSFGVNPSDVPSLAEAIQESRRIREHIRDGAPFSTKSFVSVNAGIGIEYMLTEHKAIFLQTVAQYQIPNIAFSNNNGKHLRSVSLQAGIRGPLGK